jgi:hypothetical protein
MSLVNEKYGPQGQADYVLYKLAAQFPTAFHDVTVGNNSVPCAIDQATSGYGPSPNCIAVSNELTADDETYGTAREGQIGNGTTPEYNATVGYDLATGLGSVDANVLVSNWNNITLAASTVTLTPSSTSFAHGTAITVSGNVTPSTAGGNVSLETTSTEPVSAAQNTFAVTNGAYSSGATVNYLPGGTYQIYAQYGGDGTNAMSTSAKTTITVTPESSSLLFQALNQLGSPLSLNGATAVPYGTQIELSGQPYPTSCYSTLCANATFTQPTGQVTFSDNGTTLNAATLNATGDAEYNAAFAIGAHSLTASYSGDNSYSASSVTTPTAFTVVKDTPDIYPSALVALLNSSASLSGLSGQTSLTVQIQNSANDALFQNPNIYETVVPVAAPTGTVTLSGLPGGNITFPVLQSAVDTTIGNGGNSGLVEGVAAIPLPSGLAGTYTVNISYSGDNNYNATSTGSFTFQIEPATGTATTTTATASQAATIVTSATTVAVTVTGTTSALTGTVYLFAPGGYELGAVNLTGSSSTAAVDFTVNSESLIEGTNVLTAQYLPAQNSPYAPSFALVTIQNGVNTAPNPSLTLSNSGAIMLAPGGASGTSTITVNPAGGFTGAVALSCAVTGSGATAPTCTVTSPVTISGTTAGTATLTVTSTSSTTTGAYTVTVTATGAGVTAATTAVAVTVESSTPTPAIALSNSGSVTLAAGGASGTSTITVTPSGGFTGAVALTCAITGTGTTAPTCTVTSPVTISGTTAGTATLTVTSTSSTTAGAYTATVTGTGTGVSTVTTAVSVTVQSATTTPTVTLGNSGSITIGTPGGTGTSTVSVTPGGGFTGSVSLACSISTSVSEPPTCSITSPVSITGTTAGTATLTVSTTAASAALEMPRMRLLPIGGGIAAAALLFFLAPMKRRRISTLLGALVLIAVIGFSAGCGGGSGPTPVGNSGTPTGTYSVTVSGTASGVTITPITVSVTVN